jgi:hypothetical protein
MITAGLKDSMSGSKRCATARGHRNDGFLALKFTDLVPMMFWSAPRTAARQSMAVERQTLAACQP